MAIHAQKTTFRSSAQFPDFLVTGPLTNGHILVYSDEVNAFINTTGTIGGGGDGTLDGAVNIGTGSEIFKAINVTDELELRTLLGGQGISLLEGANEIEISNDIITDSAISVADSFVVTIDNDNTTTDTAVFGVSTNSSPATIVVAPVATYVAPNLDISVVLPSSFVTASGDFVADGFVTGMCLKSTGTTEQDGIWIIDTVTTNTITITVPFTNQTDAGDQPDTTLEGMFVVFTATTLTMTGRDFYEDGFRVGYTVDVTGTTDNDGTYTIAVISGADMLINETFPVAGCDVGTITVAVPVQDHSTGWSVNELGVTISNGGTFNGDITVTSANNINIDQGTLLIDSVDIIDTINAAIFTVPTNGLITQTTSGNFTSRVVAVSGGLSIVDGDGIAGDPTISVDAFDITLDGDITGTATVTDLGNTTITTTLGDNGVVNGTFNHVTVDSTGRVTNGTNDAIVGANGITVTNGDGVAGTPTITAADFDITIAGDVIGTATVTGLADVVITVALDAIAAPGTYNSVTIDATGRVTSGSVIPGGSYQAADPELDDLSGGLTDPGFTVWDGTQYIDRTINGSTNEIVVTNGDGVASDAVIGLADDPIIPGTGSMTIPRGPAVDRPGSGVEGMIRYHADAQDFFEGYTDTGWLPFMMDEGVSFLPLAGGTMTGDITMDSNDIIDIGLVDGRDVAVDGAILDDLNTGTGIKAQVAAGDFESRTIVGTAPIVVTDGDGVAGNPTASMDITTVTALEVGQVVDEINDELIIYDDSQSAMRRISPRQLNNRFARRYFMAQF